VEFLRAKQLEIIGQLEKLEAKAAKEEGSKKKSAAAKFSNDPWGIFVEEEDDDDGDDDGTKKKKKATNSGGITRVMQGGRVIEKGACSLTLIRRGVLTADRASTIRARQQQEQQEDDDGDEGQRPVVKIQAGDSYAAAALSMVLHSRSPLVPTFRSDVRIFLVESSASPIGDGDEEETGETKEKRGIAWFGGGADLTPYYLDEGDVRFFHECYRDLCDRHGLAEDDDDKHSTMRGFTYRSMKQACDSYFYLPARQEHRGTGGIFFDDMDCSDASLDFCKGVVDTWMPSWVPIVKRHRAEPYSDEQKHWQMLRRGRYLEFNLLYDRGVKFGLANANPRVEGVMVSAPPVIAYEYNHQVREGSDEAKLVEVLKQPKDWV